MDKTILILDDDRAVLEAYGRLLKRLGCRIVLTDDPGRLLADPAQLEGIDLMILDQRMPQTTGLDLLARLRHAPSARPVPRPAVLLISALMDDDLRRRAALLGVVEVIEKPVDPLRLLSRVQAALADDPQPGRAAPGGGFS